MQTVLKSINVQVSGNPVQLHNVHGNRHRQDTFWGIQTPKGNYRPFTKDEAKTYFPAIQEKLYGRPLTKVN